MVESAPAVATGAYVVGFLAPAVRFQGGKPLRGVASSRLTAAAHGGDDGGIEQQQQRVPPHNSSSGTAHCALVSFHSLWRHTAERRNKTRQGNSYFISRRCLALSQATPAEPVPSLTGPPVLLLLHQSL